MDEEREREGRESLKEDWMERFFGGGEGLEKVRVIIIWTNENSEWVQVLLRVRSAVLCTCIMQCCKY